MLRGTRVAEAYVAISGDGSGLNEDIVKSVDKSVDDAGKDLDKKGEQHGEKYGSGFDDGFWARLRGRLAARLDDETGAMGFGNSKSSSQAAGKRLARSLLDGLDAELKNSKAASAQALQDLFDPRLRATHTFDELAKSAKDAERAVTRVEELLKRVRATGASGDLGISATLGGRISNLLGGNSRIGPLRILGQAIGGLITGIERVDEGARKMFNNFTEGFQTAADDATTFEKVLAGFGKSGGSAAEGGSSFLSTIAASGPGAVIAIAAVTAALSVAVSVINAAIAAALALAATIASGLVGALGVAGAGFLALAATAGLVVLAFKSMTKAQESLLDSAFKPLVSEAAGLGQIVLLKLIPAFATWAQHLEKALRLIEPLAIAIGGPLAKAGNVLTAALSGPGVQTFLETLTKQLPSGLTLIGAVIKNLSTAFSGFLNGGLAVFSALLPYVLQFARYVSGVATSFSDWANSTKGKNSIADFVDRAVTSLHSLYNFVVAVGTLIATVLFGKAAQNAGNSIFDSATKAVRQFIAYLNAHPDQLKKWFQEGVTFAGALGNLIIAVVKALESLNSSGVINVIATLASFARGAAGYFGDLVRAILNVVPGLSQVVGFLSHISDIVNFITGNVGKVVSGTVNGPGKPGLGLLGQNSNPGATTFTPNPKGPKLPNLPNLGSLGGGGFGGASGGAGAYNNPYTAYANSLIKNGPSIAAQVKNALLTLNKQIAAAIQSASLSSNLSTLQSNINTLVSNITTSAAQTVNTARDALNSAAQSLANASSAKAAQSALNAVHKAQASLAQALKDQKRLQAEAKILSAQKIVNSTVVNELVKGLKVQNATLADFAAARAILAQKISDANAALQNAITLHDNFKTAVTDAINTYAALTTAQAQTIGSITLALTSNDITGNLQSKLDEIKRFQSNLQVLLAEGLSNDAYKQIVDAGVQAGGAYAQALVNGGAPAVQQVNGLVSQISAIADQLGTDTSNRLYQAGVDAAQGLVDGLNSLSKQLDAAATRLGNTIAAAVKKALGIKSPSTVMRDMMDSVGDGAVLGLDNQHAKVGAAGSRLAAKVAVSPEAAAYAASRGDGVSGNSDPNGSKFRDLHVHTPTEDPMAVAHEVLNEVTGRL